MKRKADPTVKLPIRVVASPFCNPTNPYNGLLYRAVSADRDVSVRAYTYSMPPWACDILHLHWPDLALLPKSPQPVAILKMAAFWFSLIFARLAGVRIVWTAHNSFPHDREPYGLDLFLWKRFLSTLSGVIFLSDESKQLITREYPSLTKLPSELIKHGHYGPWIDSVRDTAAAPVQGVIRALDVLKGSFVVLNFGAVRPYKNTDELMRHFSALADPDVRLLIAGRVVDPGYLLTLKALAEVDRRIVLLPQHLDDASLVACLERADLVVLPYRKILNSGSALTAMSFGKHVVVPAIGSMPSLQRDVGVDALTLYEGPFNADILSLAIQRVRSNAVSRPDLRQYDWPLLGAQLSQYYRRLMSSFQFTTSQPPSSGS